MADSLPMHVAESLVGLKKTKGGRDDKEPAYKISRRRCRSYAWCVLISGVAALALGLLLYESAEARAALAPAWAAAVRARRAAQHVGHFRATRLGQELERHLERDMAEREWALLARSRLNRLEAKWRGDVAAAAAARAHDDGCAGAVEDVRDQLLTTSDAMWSELRQTLSLLDALVSRGASAEQQHDSVQREILDELRRDSEERAQFASHASQAHGGRDASEAGVARAISRALGRPEIARRPSGKRRSGPRRARAQVLGARRRGAQGAAGRGRVAPRPRRPVPRELRPPRRRGRRLYRRAARPAPRRARRARRGPRGRRGRRGRRRRPGADDVARGRGAPGRPRAEARGRARAALRAERADRGRRARLRPDPQRPRLPRGPQVARQAQRGAAARRPRARRLRPARAHAHGIRRGARGARGVGRLPVGLALLGPRRPRIRRLGKGRPGRGRARGGLSARHAP